MRAWLYRRPPPHLPTGTSSFAEHWFRERGAEVLTFTIEALNAGALDRDLREEPDRMVVVGGIDAVHAVLARAGRPVPRPHDLPEPLLPFAGRRAWTSTLGEVRRIQSV